MDMERKVLIFGKTGSGKSTVGNMLVHGNLIPPLAFATGDTLLGVTELCCRKSGNGYEVTDTVGLGEETADKAKDARETIKKFLDATKNISFHHILFVRPAGRMDNLDAAIWKACLDLFWHEDEREKHAEDRYRNLVLVLTGCKSPDKWLKDNEAEMKRFYGEVQNRIIAVDFPAIEDDETLEGIFSARRDKDLQRLKRFLDQFYSGEVYHPTYRGKDESQLYSFANFVLNKISYYAQKYGTTTMSIVTALFKGFLAAAGR